MKFLSFVFVATLFVVSLADCSTFDAVALTIYYEANLSNNDDMQGVSSVIRNRVVHPEFPRDPKAVVQQRNQFEVWGPGGNARRSCDNGSRPSGQAWEKVKQLANQVINGSIRDNTQNAQFFHQSRNPPSPRTRFTVQYGVHFYFTIYRAKELKEKNIEIYFEK